MPAGEDGEVAAATPLASATSTPGADSPAGTPSYLDWASALQTLYGSGPATPGTTQPFCPTPSSPSPCIWGAQMYGTPISYTSLYSHGAVYAHPSTSSGATVATRETEANLLEGLKKGSGDKFANADPLAGNCGDSDKATCGFVNADSLRNADLVTGDCGDDDEGTSGSVDVNTSHSDESRGEESSKNSRDNETTPCGLSISVSGSYNQLLSAPVKVASSLPETSLNNGMDPWNSPHSMASNISGSQNTVGILSAGSTMIGLKSTAPENKMIHDERERKRQKRKLSNRESARRSRERKQKECEELARQVVELNTENNDVRTEIEKLNAECKKLEYENASIEEELKQLYGPSALVAIE